jgi:hypothetical protein
MSTLMDPRGSVPPWIPPALIPAVDVLDLRMQPLRSEISAEAQVALAGQVKETDDILALSARMMRAGDETYARHVMGLPPVERRLHWLAWTLEPMTDSGLVYLVFRLGPAERRALHEALVEAGMEASSAAVGAMLPLLPAKPAQHADLPEALRKRMEALVTSRGGRGNLMREIDAYLDRDAEAKAFIDRVRGSIDDQTRVYFLFRTMIDHFGNDTQPAKQLARLNALPIPHRVIWLVHVYRSELHNGGIEQNFSNSGGALAPETAAALQLLGLDAHAAVMERGIALFPKPYPRDRNSPRWPADISDKLYPLGEGLNGDDIDPALAAYARREGALPN